MGMPDRDKEPVPDNGIKEKAHKLSFAVADLHWDIEAISWASEQLWHHEFSTGKDNERLSRFPVAILRLLATQIGTVRDQAEELQRVVGWPK